MVVPAAAEGSCATIQLLAGRDDADVNMETNDGRTALYFAALDGKVVHRDTHLLYVVAGADIGYITSR